MATDQHKQDKADLSKIEADSAFIHEQTDRYLETIGGQLNSENMGLLNVNQHTLLAYRIILDEVMEGGFIQLIQNGWGPYIFNNPFAKILREWGEKDLANLIFSAGNYYRKHKEELEADMSEEDFMALYEAHEELNDMGDDFLDEIQEFSTPSIANYVREHQESF
jgi:hypothetical protein